MLSVGSWPYGQGSDPQVPEKAKRRTYTAKYKRDILAEYEACDREAGCPAATPGNATAVLDGAGEPGGEEHRPARDGGKVIEIQALGSAGAVLDRQQHGARALIDETITELVPLVA